VFLCVHCLFLCAAHCAYSINNNKLAVRQAFRAYENAHCDELDAHFLNKNIPEFWKLWNKKFNKSLQNIVRINGLDSNKLIAEEFAKNFSQVYI